ncbi:recombinase family protein, partial [Enterococcus faecium]|uniref:recombinase family protein n=1 Tax=Enterococcus faecium TaxID=1352 RepID=UPI003F74401D
KVKRDNGTLSQWSTHFVRMILDNPVYCGKIALADEQEKRSKVLKMNIAKYVKMITLLQMGNMTLS